MDSKDLPHFTCPHVLPPASPPQWNQSGIRTGCLQFILSIIRDGEQILGRLSLEAIVNCPAMSINMGHHHGEDGGNSDSRYGDDENDEEKMLVTVVMRTVTVVMMKMLIVT